MIARVALDPPRRRCGASLSDDATFLTTNEKRAAAGYGPAPPPLIKFNRNHDDLGRFTFGDADGDDHEDAPQADPSEWPTWDNPSIVPIVDGLPPKRLEDALKPEGNFIGQRGTTSRIRIVTYTEFEKLAGDLLKGAAQVEQPASYQGRWFSRKDGTVFGIRHSLESGPTIDVIKGGASGISDNFKVHIK